MRRGIKTKNNVYGTTHALFHTHPKILFNLSGYLLLTLLVKVVFVVFLAKGLLSVIIQLNKLYKEKG